MNRRKFLQGLFAAAISGGGAATGVVFMKGKPEEEAYQIDTAIYASSAGLVSVVAGFFAGQWLLKDFNDDDSSPTAPH